MKISTLKAIEILAGIVALLAAIAFFGSGVALLRLWVDGEAPSPIFSVVGPHLAFVASIAVVAAMKLVIVKAESAMRALMATA